MPVGRRSPCVAALCTAAAGSTRERPLEWWALRGSPDVVARPPSWVAVSITIGRREELWSTSSSMSVPLLRLSIGITGGGTTGWRGIVPAHVLSGLGLGALVVIAAAVPSSRMPLPPPPSPVVGWDGRMLTMPHATATTTGRPLEEAAGGTGLGGHPPAAATAWTGAGITPMAATPMMSAIVVSGAGVMRMVIPMAMLMTMGARGAMLTWGGSGDTGLAAAGAGVVMGRATLVVVMDVWMTMKVAAPMSMGIAVVLDAVVLPAGDVGIVREVMEMAAVGGSTSSSHASPAAEGTPPGGRIDGRRCGLGLVDRYMVPLPGHFIRRRHRAGRRPPAARRHFISQGVRRLVELRRSHSPWHHVRHHVCHHCIVGLGGIIYLGIVTLQAQRRWRDYRVHMIMVICCWCMPVFPRLPCSSSL